MVSRVLVDGGSSSNILFWDAFQRIGIEKEEIRLIKTTLHAFNGGEVKPLGIIALAVYALQEKRPSMACDSHVFKKMLLQVLIK